MRRTQSAVRVARALLADPQGRHYGYSLRKQTEVRSGVLYPILWRMLDAGWLAAGQEDPAEIKQKRPPRRYYQITAEGRDALARLAEVALWATAGHSVADLTGPAALPGRGIPTQLPR